VYYQELEEELGPCLAVFMLATYGEGDPTDNAMEFHEKLTNDGLELNGLKFAVFGLGKIFFLGYWLSSSDMNSWHNDRRFFFLAILFRFLSMHTWYPVGIRSSYAVVSALPSFKINSVVALETWVGFAKLSRVSVLLLSGIGY
jgi:hypothetical protein